MKTQPDAPMVYGLFHDLKETSALTSRARATMIARGLYEQGALVCPGFTPVPLPETIKKLRQEAVGSVPAEFGFVKVCVQDGVQYPLVEWPKPLSYPRNKNGRSMIFKTCNTKAIAFQLRTHRFTNQFH